MTFLNNPILWGLFAAAIPVIIHLLNRRRHRTVKWAAMAFILKATRESRGKKKLKHFLILTARTLAVAALVFAIAQPLVGGFLGWGGNKLDTVVLVLDRSLSMESETGVDGVSKREQAISQIKQTLKEMGNPNLVLIDSATGKIQTIEDLSALDVLSTTAASDTEADIPALVDTAINYTLGNETGETEIWVASDLQKSNWQNDSPRWETIRSGLNNPGLKTQPKLRILALTARSKDNRSVSIKSVRRLGNKLVVDFDINRRDDSREELVEASIMVNGKQHKVEKYAISGQTVSLQEAIDLSGASISGYGYITIGPDSNKSDNNAFFAYGEAIASHTVIVTEGGESTLYLEGASSLPGYKHQSAEVIEAHQLKSNMLNKASMVVWQAPLPDKDNATLIKQFINDGGTAIFLPSEEDSDNTFLGASWKDIQRSSPGQYFVITKWDEVKGPQRNYSNGETMPLDSITAIKRRPLGGDVTSLADWDDGNTAMGRIVEGQGTAYFISSLPERHWSNLDTASVIVHIFQNMLIEGNKRFGSAFFSETGRHSILAANQDDLKSVIDNSEVNKRYSVEQDSIKSNSLYLAGVKRIDERIVATNRPTVEDDWSEINESQLGDILNGTNYSLFENSGESGDSPTKRIWQWMLIAALVFLIIEAILCLAKKATKKASSNNIPAA